MVIDQQAINDFKRIYTEEFGEEISDREAWEMGLNLLNLFVALTGRQTSIKVENPQNLTDESPKS